MEKAVAVKYIESLPAPFIVARGRGELARRIKKIAEENEIQIVSMPELTEALIELDVDSLIPEEFYQIIAELLVYVKGLKVKV
ncbi:hypothetical protein ES703_65905 [subsurface metagenome]